MHNALQPFTYIDPVTGQSQTVNVSPRQRAQLKKYLKQRAKALKQAQRAAGQANLNLPPVTSGISGMPSSVPIGAGGYVTPAMSNTLMPMQSNCANACLPQSGWVLPVLSQMAAQSRFAISLDPENSIFVNSTNPLALGYTDPMSLLQACLLAVQGNATKAFGQGLWPTPAADTTITPAATTVFGIRGRITNSVLNYKFGTYVVNVLNGGTVQSTINIVARKLPVDFVVLSISNNAGVATVVPNTAPALQFLAASNPALVPASDVLYAETLNMRDVGTISQLSSQFMLPQSATAGVPLFDTYDARQDGDDDNDTY